MSTIAWVSWVSLVMATALTTSNPLYLAIMLLAVILVGVLAPKTETGVAGFWSLLLFGLSLLVFSLFIAVINGSGGNHTLVTLPGPQLPRWMGGLELGGPVTAEGLLMAGIRGMTILTILLAFATFNGAISPHRVLRMTPAALFHAGLVVTIGLTLLPSSIEDARRVREMQALRGRRTGLRNLAALTVPTVLGGLERSMRLAEAMEARGYASTPAAPGSARLVAVMAAPLLLVSAWTWLYLDGFELLSASLALLGVAGLGYWMMVATRIQRTTRLKRELVPPVERAAVCASFGLAVVVVVGAMSGAFESTYSPFVNLAWPEFEPFGAAVALASVWPAVRMAFSAPVSAEMLSAMEAEVVRV